MITAFEEDQQTEVPTNRNEEPPEQNVRRLTRTRTQSTRIVVYQIFLDHAVYEDGDLIEEAMMMAEAEPINLDQVMNNSNWLPAMKEKLRSIEKNKTWELVKKSVKKAIDVKWGYKMKQKLNGEISKHKERLLERGFL